MTEPGVKTPPSRVTVTDVNIPFASMVVLMVKWAIAAIPALLILAVLGGIATAVAGGVVAGISQARRADATRDEQSEYQRDVVRWREECGQYKGRSVVASAEEQEFRSCKAQEAALTRRAAALGATAP